MKLQDAIKKKNSLPETYEHNDFQFSVVIVPANADDKTRFIENSSIDEIFNHSEILASKYSSNSEFKVIGLWTNGADFMSDSELNIN